MWPTLAGYEEEAGIFEPIRKWEVFRENNIMAFGSVGGMIFSGTSSLT